MKKIVLFAAVAAMGLASCTSQAPKANLKSDIDSLSYMIGVNQGNGLSEVATTHMGIDSAFVAEFLKGIEAGAAEGASAQHGEAMPYGPKLKVRKAYCLEHRPTHQLCCCSRR